MRQNANPGAIYSRAGVFFSSTEEIVKISD
jgi:hypothetical protein